MPTVAVAVNIVLFRLQAPLRALANALVDPAVRDSPTWLALEAKRKEKEQQRDGDIFQQFGGFCIVAAANCWLPVSPALLPS
jgi:hypothetical protein